ncbi:hypothetical protein ACLOJK_010353 [Asimina triloba]
MNIRKVLCIAAALLLFLGTFCGKRKVTLFLPIHPLYYIVVLVVAFIHSTAFSGRATVETVTEVGDPREVICEAVEKLNVDLLILGSDGRTAIQRAFLGSVSNYCVQNGKCPVLIRQSSSVVPICCCLLFSPFCCSTNSAHFSSPPTVSFLSSALPASAAAGIAEKKSGSCRLFSWNENSGEVPAALPWRVIIVIIMEEGSATEGGTKGCCSKPPVVAPVEKQCTWSLALSPSWEQLSLSAVAAVAADVPYADDESSSCGRDEEDGEPTS